MDDPIVFDPALIRKYDKTGPRYTSYPTVVQFHAGFGEREYRAQIERSNAAGRPLSLYFHIPFCDTVCFYCACSKVITRNRSRASDYLQRIYREIALQGALFDHSRSVKQLHWGGGTPTFISRDEMRELMAVTREHFKLLDGDAGEYSIEIDPRAADERTIELLRVLGFNRLSVGVQDFDPRVQVAVNRLQSRAVTTAAIETARAVGFRSVSVDLIYGLPYQSVDTFAATLEAVIALNPDRLAVFNYAHLPQMFKSQRRIDPVTLPSAGEKLRILRSVIERLTGAGYVYLGMDHFAKPGDALAIAQREGALYRNFQGYSTHADCDLVGMGATAIGMVGTAYAQNVKDVADYGARLDAGRLPVARGIELSHDDLLRRDVIIQLICNLRVESAMIEALHGIRFVDYFAEELSELRDMEADQLLRFDGEDIRVLPAGRLLIRNVCMVFDRYLRDRSEMRFSKVI